MPRSKTYIYGLYDNGTLIYSGTRLDIVRTFRLPETFNVSPYVKAGVKFQRKYDVKILAVTTYKEENYKTGPSKEKKENPEEIRKRDIIDNNLLMLKTWGNAFTGKEYLEETLANLKAHGIEVTVRICNGERLSSIKHKGRKKEEPIYILERT